MPAVQPFVVPGELAAKRGWVEDRERLTFEVLDAFELYGTAGSQAIVWLTRQQARSLPAATRQAQPAPHRWPTGRIERDLSTVVRYVERGRRASRHHEISDQQWSTAANVLPDARQLAGTFASSSGPNCFSTVMAAAGVTDATDEWMQVGPFEQWLEKATAPGGSDGQPGTVLVWRDDAGVPAHAAVTIGAGWFLHKPSQGWMSPRLVLNIQDGKYSVRHPGLRLHRRQITQG